jgi:hypothetical protein
MKFSRRSVFKREDDKQGSHFIIDADNAMTPGGIKRPGCPLVEVWWSRDGKRADETIIIRQEWAGRDTAEVLEVTQGQAYDLMKALADAMERK